MTGVVTRHQFVFSDDSFDKQFQDYINYMIREEAVTTDETKQIALFNDYIYKDFDDKENLRHEKLFTENKDSLSKAEAEEIKKCFQYAQENKSCMWQDVISFDNQWLANNGLYDNETGAVDIYRLHEITRKYMNTLLESEQLNDSTIWTASIHFNTKHTHIHIATVEPIPTREKVTKKEYYGESKGMFKKKTILNAKSAVVNDIISKSQDSILINDIIRKRIIDSKKKDSLLLADDELTEKFLKLHEMLPWDKRLWKYNNNAMKDYRPLIDEISKMYIDQYHKDDFEELEHLLKMREEKYKDAYGKADKFGSYSEHKIEDLYTRLGNTILNEVKEYDYAKKKAFLEKEKSGIKIVSSLKKWRNPTISNSSIKKLKSLLDDDYRHFKNQQIYEELENEHIHSNSNDYEY